jgi:hypothetical protein
MLQNGVKLGSYWGTIDDHIDISGGKVVADGVMD